MAKIFEINGLFKIGDTYEQAQTTMGFKAKADAQAQLNITAPSQYDRNKAINEMLQQYPKDAAEINEARISGSPMHIVAARLADKYTPRQTNNISGSGISASGNIIASGGNGKK